MNEEIPAAPVQEKQPQKKIHSSHVQHAQSLLHYKRLGRELAMQYLFELDLMGGMAAEDSMEEFWNQAEESGEFPSNRTFRKARTYAEKLIGLAREHETDLIEKLEQVSKAWDFDRMSAVDRNILKVAICEMEYCPDIPHLVSIDEAIEISKDFSDERSKDFINGILNAIMKAHKDKESK